VERRRERLGQLDFGAAIGAGDQWLVHRRFGACAFSVDASHVGAAGVCWSGKLAAMVIASGDKDRPTRWGRVPAMRSSLTIRYGSAAARRARASAPR
jgi:hypothetical protein